MVDHGAGPSEHDAAHPLLAPGATTIVYAGDTLGTMSRPTKKSRGIRVTDQVWDAAKAEADRRGEFLNEAIDRFLIAYADGGDVTTSRAKR